MHINKFGLALVGTASALSLNALFKVNEGKKPCKNELRTKPVNCPPKENKKQRTRINIEQSWMSSTSGSTITRKTDQNRKRRTHNNSKKMRQRHHKVKKSVSLSKSIEKPKKSCRMCKIHGKRGYSLSESASGMRRRTKSHNTSRKQRKGRKVTAVRVKPRKHNHHSRHVTVTENTESSTYALDVTEKKHQSRSVSVSAESSNSHSASRSNVSINKTVKAKKDKKCKKNKKDKTLCKKHQKREDVVEGKKARTKKVTLKKPVKKSAMKVKKSVSKSTNHSSASCSDTESCSARLSCSDNVCSFKRIPIKKCAKGGCTKKKPTKGGNKHCKKDKCKISKKDVEVSSSS
jgi:hypothetical protein